MYCCFCCFFLLLLLLLLLHFTGGGAVHGHYATYESAVHGFGSIKNLIKLRKSKPHVKLPVVGRRQPACVVVLHSTALTFGPKIINKEDTRFVQKIVVAVPFSFFFDNQA
jgi:hypothetical protein